VARFIQYLYYGICTFHAHKFAELTEWSFVRKGLQRTDDRSLPVDLLKRSMVPIASKFSELIPAWVSMYVFADKYQVPKLQKMMLNELFEWEPNDQWILKLWFWDIVSQLKDECPVSDE
jgi:hypothetical protein